jgi:hypothetical protein
MIATTSIRVHRASTVLRPDQSRVLLRPFRHEDPERSRRIIARIMSLQEDQVGPLLDEVSAEFSPRHQQIQGSFLERFEQVREFLPTDKEISEQRQLLNRFLFCLRILVRICCAVQPVHRAAP